MVALRFWMLGIKSYSLLVVIYYNACSVANYCDDMVAIAEQTLGEWFCPRDDARSSFMAAGQLLTSGPMPFCLCKPF